MDPRDEPLLPLDCCAVCGLEWMHCTCCPIHRRHNGPRCMEARYAGRCARCGAAIAAGDVVVRLHRVRGVYCLGDECGLRLLGAPQARRTRG